MARSNGLALAAVLFSLAAAATAARVGPTFMHWDSFATLTLEPGTFKWDNVNVCPFAATKQNTTDAVTCGQEFVIYWNNQTTNDAGVYEAELLQSGAPTAKTVCQDGKGDAPGGGKMFPVFGIYSDTPSAHDTILGSDESTGAFLLTGYKGDGYGGRTEVCSAIYTVTEDDGLADFLWAL